MMIFMFSRNNLLDENQGSIKNNGFGSPIIAISNIVKYFHKSMFEYYGMALWKFRWPFHSKYFLGDEKDTSDGPIAFFQTE